MLLWKNIYIFPEKSKLLKFILPIISSPHALQTYDGRFGRHRPAMRAECLWWPIINENISIVSRFLRTRNRTNWVFPGNTKCPLSRNCCCCEARVYPGLRSEKRVGLFLLLLLLDGMLQCSLPPALNSPVPTPTWGKVSVKCFAQRPRFEPGRLAPESSALAIRPQRLPYSGCIVSFNSSLDISP